jgi:hypothetical protein
MKGHYDSQDNTTLASEQTLSQAELNAIFEKELKMVYAEIDKNSDLLWSARTNQEFIRFGGLRTRRNAKAEEEGPKWERESNATFGYGEITRVST